MGKARGLGIRLLLGLALVMVIAAGCERRIVRTGGIGASDNYPTTEEPAPTRW